MRGDRGARTAGSPVNFSAIFINVAERAAARAALGGTDAPLAIYETILFSWVAIEALLNERAYVEVRELQIKSERVYESVSRGAKGFERIQAVLEFLFGRGLEEGRNPATDLQHLQRLRNAIVHYRFERPPSETLDDLAQRGMLDKGWRSSVLMGWPIVLTSKVADWSLETACAAGIAVSDLMPSELYGAEVNITRGIFESFAKQHGRKKKERPSKNPSKPEEKGSENG